MFAPKQVQLFVFLVCLSVASLVVAEIPLIRPAKDYIKPLVRFWYFGQVTRADYNQALRELATDAEQNAGDSPEEIMKFFEENHHKHLTDEVTERSGFDLANELTNWDQVEEPWQCTMNSVDSIMDTIDLMFGHLEGRLERLSTGEIDNMFHPTELPHYYVKFLRFLLHYFEKKVTGCVTHLPEAWAEYAKDYPREEEAMDALISKNNCTIVNTIKKCFRSNDQVLYETAAAAFEFKHIIPVIIGDKTLMKMCQAIATQAGDFIGMHDLNRAFFEEKAKLYRPDSYRFVKMEEYVRLCNRVTTGTLKPRKENEYIAFGET